MESFVVLQLSQIARVISDLKGRSSILGLVSLAQTRLFSPLVATAFGLAASIRKPCWVTLQLAILALEVLCPK
jgi:hypothetical protein